MQTEKAKNDENDMMTTIMIMMTVVAIPLSLPSDRKEKLSVLSPPPATTTTKEIPIRCLFFSKV